MDESLVKEIKEYCKLNNIEDIDRFINSCLRKGFNILKYGLSPIDNFKIENEIYDTEKSKRNSLKENETIQSTVQKCSGSKKNGNGEEKEHGEKVVKRKIRIIKRESKDV